MEKCGKGKHLTDKIECDDGNLLDGDGCDHTCRVESENFFKCRD